MGPAPHERVPSSVEFLKQIGLGRIYPFMSVRVTRIITASNETTAGRRRWMVTVDRYVRLIVLGVAIVALIISFLDGRR